MSRSLFAAILGVLILVTAPSLARAQEGLSTSVPELIASRPNADRTLVRIEGEAIGDVMRADDTHVWVNVLDEGVAIGVYAPRAEAAAVSVLGDWAHRGDRILVTGDYNGSCAVHGGETDVHARTLRVVVPGERIPRPISWWKGLAGVGGMFVALLVRVAPRRREE